MRHLAVGWQEDSFSTWTRRRYEKKEQLVWGGTKSVSSRVAGVGAKDLGDKEPSFFSPLEKGAGEGCLQPKRFIHGILWRVSPPTEIQAALPTSKVLSSP